MTQKIIVVTGCSKRSGVGYHLVEQLLSRQHRVIATVRNLASSELQVIKCSAPNRLSLKSLDLCDPLSIQNFIANVLDEYSHIDVLVNNAAEVVIGALETSSPKDIQTTFQTKVFGPIALIQGFLPCMRQRRDGLFITTSSMFCTSHFAVAGLPLYLAALSAFERIQESLAVEVAPWNIKVVNFQPGPIKTNLSRHEGSNTAISDAYYPHYLRDAYRYFDRFQWQDPQEVARIYADIIESTQPDFTVQSSTEATQYVKQYRQDATGNRDFKELCDYFASCIIKNEKDSSHE
jgi:NAD(P)-dependent dehydrogenase (short-subunit alcohol dehydrogenase family)